MNSWRPFGSCNNLRGTDGTAFKPNVKDSDTLYVFETMLCKIFKFQNDDSVTKSSKLRGIKSKRFYLTPDNYNRELPNACHCWEDSLDDCPAVQLNIRFCGVADHLMNLIASTPYFFPYKSELQVNTSQEVPLDYTYENYGTFVDVEPVSYKIYNFVLVLIRKIQ